MDSEPDCFDLLYDRPPSVSPDRWLDVWQDACAHRLVPDLRTFNIAPNRCRLSIRRGDEPTPNLDAVARILATCER